MVEIKWIKLSVGMFDDEKIKLIRKMPEGTNILLVWIYLLMLAGKTNASGYIFLAENIPYTEEMLSSVMDMPLNIVRIALKTFSQFGMINVDENNLISISNWDKHQNIDGLDKIREQNRLRKQKQREREKSLMAPVRDEQGAGKSHVTSRDSHSTDIDIDKEEDIDKEKDKEEDNNIIILTQEQARFMEILGSIENYPVDRKKDLDMYNRLEERYPTLDLVESLKDWATYKLDKPLKAKDNPRSQINTSFKKYVEWGKNLKGENTNGKHESTNGKGTKKAEYDTSSWYYNSGN